MEQWKRIALTTSASVVLICGSASAYRSPADAYRSSEFEQLQYQVEALKYRVNELENPYVYRESKKARLAREKKQQEEMKSFQKSLDDLLEKTGIDLRTK